MKVQNTDITFKAGLTSNFKRCIKYSDTRKISLALMNNGIESDFKNNKVLAWASFQCFRIINALNNWYNLNLGLPKGIFVEDFNKLKIKDKAATGFLNFAPTKLYIGEDKVTPEKTIFFNEFKGFNYSGGNEYWDRIDTILDENFDKHFTSTDFFLEPILHEFLHAVHEQNLIQKLGANKAVKLLEETLNPQKLETFRAKYGRMFEKICTYASESPFEAVACDFSKRTIENLDKTTLLPQSNFIQRSPYRNLSPLKRLFIYESETIPTRTLRRFWEGKME